MIRLYHNSQGHFTDRLNFDSRCIQLFRVIKHYKFYTGHLQYNKQTNMYLHYSANTRESRLILFPISETVVQIL